MTDQIVGWGNGIHWANAESVTASRKLGEAFYRLGVRDVFGILGGGIAPFAHGLMQNPFRFFHFKHESGAGFGALESFFATERPALVVVTTGPGLFNSLNSMAAAKADGAKLILISGASTRAQRGRSPVQETSSTTMPYSYLFEPSPLFHYASQPETIEELKFAIQRIQIGLKSSGGFVAHLSLPGNLQTLAVDPQLSLIGEDWEVFQNLAPPSVIKRSAESLLHTRSVFWVGHGARHSAALLREVAELTGTPVILSPRAKGVFDESHPLCIGVSGAGGHSNVSEFFKTYSPEFVFVLGSRLGEVTSFFRPELVPKSHWIHVDIDPTAFGQVYPGSAKGLGVSLECEVFLSQILEQIKVDSKAIHPDRQKWQAPPHGVETENRLQPSAEGPVRPVYLMQVIQEEILNHPGNEATPPIQVMSEAGNAFTWCNYYLKFKNPHQYRTSSAWGSMGHFTTGVVGAALSSGRPAVAVVGDGSMLMNNEISTAVQYRARCIWLVLNDSQLGLNEHGMKALGMPTIETALHPTDFVAFAMAQGAQGQTIHHETELRSGILWALSQTGPVVLDIKTDPSAVSPILLARTQSLKNQQS